MSERFEERALAFVLVLAGLVGVAIGAGSPNAHALELVLGAALVAFGTRTLWRSRTESVV